ncbi:hypothetical protein ACIBEA_16025 [Streptomyces sp. NPDC051555]|uniref:hypothetical protein n=1 Tax=Streptomyces sp. NPDC051555 TaxID=3365657 RepID=UPI00378A7569
MAALLYEERLAAIEDRAAAELATGHEVDGHELAALVTEHPGRSPAPTRGCWREPVGRKAMIVLSRI